MKTKPSCLLLAGLFVASSFFVACGSDDEDPSGTGGAATGGKSNGTGGRGDGTGGRGNGCGGTDPITGGQGGDGGDGGQGGQDEPDAGECREDADCDGDISVCFGIGRSPAPGVCFDVESQCSQGNCTQCTDDNDCSALGETS